MKYDISRGALNWHLEKYQNFRGALSPRLIHQLENQFTSLKISSPAWDRLPPGSAVRTPG